MKKLCEGCKVRQIRWIFLIFLIDSFLAAPGGERGKLIRCGFFEQSVRRKGYVYIICSKNAKHKQRQG